MTTKEFDTMAREWLTKYRMPYAVQIDEWSTTYLVVLLKNKATNYIVVESILFSTGKGKGEALEDFLRALGRDKDGQIRACVPVTFITCDTAHPYQIVSSNNALRFDFYET